MEDLLRRIQYEGDQAAFREFYLSQAPQLLNFAFVYIKSKFIAEEVVNDVFMNLWRSRQRIHEIANLRVYLYVGVRNGISSYFSRNKDWQHVDIDTVSEASLDFTADPEQQLITAELRQRIEGAVAALPPKCRIIFKMVKEDGLKYREVAEILNLSVKTVENQLTIAIRKISAEIFLCTGDPRKTGYLSKL
ncbi:RNA polymerase sigma-70 factor [Chitinophaga arvensicola]|uniref:RNA polymerase sigma-70 factor, ECF subfamily n=1 Tax=Chitinophaga arvensicola TaxID=29529 RepID=A0A1I0R7A1_9BACT|nr:RNA polymerase sigma-70 factor [Chitinophaga arvensicola]SEW36590.1 RNA polymerase sigma-70 factor, ECF subfamily [Chitinophaga arvensicola]